MKIDPTIATIFAGLFALGTAYIGLRKSKSDNSVQDNKNNNDTVVELTRQIAAMSVQIGDLNAQISSLKTQITKLEELLKANNIQY